jgi:hypothetical protein
LEINNTQSIKQTTNKHGKQTNKQNTQQKVEEKKNN